MFESNEHSIPAFPSPVEEMAFVPVVTMVTELAEIVMGEVVFTLTFLRTILISLFVTSTLYAVEVPVTTTVSIESSFIASHVTFPADTVTDSAVMLHVILKMK
jgi:hypothetical protein